MPEITELLGARDARGRPDLSAVFEHLYLDLKRIAAARVSGGSRDETLSATGLVNEAYLKLVGAEHLSLENRKHFFACAARAMRQILIDRARIAQAGKRGAAFEHVTLEGCEVAAEPLALFDLDRALEDLEQIDSTLRELVELRYFAGLSLPQIAELRSVSLRTAARDWERARALLRIRLESDGQS